MIVSIWLAGLVGIVSAFVLGVWIRSLWRIDGDDEPKDPAAGLKREGKE